MAFYIPIHVLILNIFVGWTILNLFSTFSNTEVIISSSWREHYDFSALQQLFPKSIQKQIIGVTPVITESSYDEGGRELEIVLWLQQQKREHENWIAIDDNISCLINMCTKSLNVIL